MSVKNEEVADKLQEELIALMMKNSPKMLQSYAEEVVFSVRRFGGLDGLRFLIGIEKVKEDAYRRGISEEIVMSNGTIELKKG